MKYLLLLLLLPLSSIAQKDFDYTVYTTHAMTSIDLRDSFADLLLPRKIQKKDNTLKIIDLNNTGVCITYPLHFIGFNTDINSIIYTDDKGQTILINPMLPLITIGRIKYY